MTSRLIISKLNQFPPKITDWRDYKNFFLLLSSNQPYLLVHEKIYYDAIQEILYLLKKNNFNSVYHHDVHYLCPGFNGFEISPEDKFVLELKMNNNFCILE